MPANAAFQLVDATPDALGLEFRCLTDVTPVTFRLLSCTQSDACLVAHVARNAAARRLLRVCWAAPQAERLNCCRCEKCLRTMVALQAVGELHVDEAFSLPLKLSAVRRIRLAAITRDLWQENRDLLAQTGRDPKLLATVDRLLEPNPFRRWRQQVKAWNRQRRLLRRQPSRQTEGVSHD